MIKTKEIKLANNKGTALVDDEDFPHLSKFKWALCNGYAQRCYVERGMCKSLFMHREIMNPPPDMVVDHLDENRLNNQKKNLNITSTGGNFKAWRDKRNHTMIRGKEAWTLVEEEKSAT